MEHEKFVDIIYQNCIDRIGNQHFGHSFFPISRNYLYLQSLSFYFKVDNFIGAYQKQNGTKGNYLLND